MELDAILVDVEEDAAAEEDASGVGAVRLRPPPVQLVPVAYFCVVQGKIANSDFCFIGFGGAFVSLPSSFVLLSFLATTASRCLRGAAFSR